MLVRTKYEQIPLNACALGPRFSLVLGKLSIYFISILFSSTIFTLLEK